MSTVSERISERIGLKPWAIRVVVAFLLGLLIGWLLFGLALRPDLREETITGVVDASLPDGSSVCITEDDGEQTCVQPALPAGASVPRVGMQITAEIVWLQPPEPAGGRLASWRTGD